MALGRRIGFYRIKSDLGAGNFSKVKLATHQLTKGKGIDSKAVIHDSHNNFDSMHAKHETAILI